MRFEEQSYVINNYPPLSSDFWNKPVLELVDQLNYYDDASMDQRQNIWPECMKAYLCRRELPEFESMELLDDSPYGETDIWEGVNFLSDAIVTAQMPRDQSWLEMLSTNAEDQALLNDVRDLMMSIHRNADTRGQIAKHYKQCLIYGTSALWYRWHKLVKLVKKGQAQTLETLRAANPSEDLEVLAAQALKARIKEVRFNGPIIAPIDMYDFWLDPMCDMSRQHDYPIIARYYMTIDELKAAKDENGEPKYSNLEDLEPQDIAQILNGQEQRFELMTELGVSPLVSSRGRVKLVPIYCFHAPVRRFDSQPGHTFVDCFFYIAKSATKEGWRLIRIEDSPYPNGSRGIYVDTYVDNMNGGYGIGVVEKSINAWQYKNVLAAIGLQQQVLSVAPSYSVIADSLTDGNKVKLGPGGVTFIRGNKAGHQFIQPVPVPIDKMRAGQDAEQWYGQKILSQMQAYGAINNDPTKTYKDDKTATQVNVETTSGSVVRDNFLEKTVLRSLEPLMQDVYDCARLYLEDQKIINFERTVDGQTALGNLSYDDLNKDRKVQVTGYHGLINKANEMKQMNEALQVLTTGNALQYAPQLVPVVQELILKIVGRLGAVKNVERFKQDPVQMILQDPQIQQKLLQDPMFSQLIQQMAQAVAGGQSGPEPQQHPAPPADPNVPQAGAGAGEAPNAGPAPAPMPQPPM